MSNSKSHDSFVGKHFGKSPFSLEKKICFPKISLKLLRTSSLNALGFCSRSDKIDCSFAGYGLIFDLDKKDTSSVC